jgi:hypothetical protein
MTAIEDNPAAHRHRSQTGSSHRAVQAGDELSVHHGLVNAVNHLFMRPERPFLIDEIEFSPAAAAGKADARAIQTDGALCSFPHLGVAGGKAHVETRSRGAAGCVAAEIARMLTGSCAAVSGRSRHRTSPCWSPTIGRRRSCRWRFARAIFRVCSEQRERLPFTRSG